MIIILFFIGILIGMGRGFLGTIFDFVSIFVALYAGSFIYLVPVKLLAGFGITGGVAGLICYVCICVCLMFASGILLERIRRKIRMKHFADRFFGGVLGTADGLIFASALMIIMSVSPGKAKEIDKNIFFTGIRNFIPKTYENFERAGITIPKMISLPSSYPQEFKPRNEGMRFTKFNFTRLDGSHCLRCGGIVRFTGYIPKYGTALVPKFICEKCKRTSDGCQTYEGFHKIYGTCPIELAEKGQMFDCGNWPNYLWIIPEGPCPLDGRGLDMRFWREPLPY